MDIIDFEATSFDEAFGQPKGWSADLRAELGEVICQLMQPAAEAYYRLAMDMAKESKQNIKDLLSNKSELLFVLNAELTALGYGHVSKPIRLAGKIFELMPDAPAPIVYMAVGNYPALNAIFMHFVDQTAFLADIDRRAEEIIMNAPEEERAMMRWRLDQAKKGYLDGSDLTDLLGNT